MTVAHKASVFSGSNASSYATGSWTPGANRMAIASVENEIGSGTPTTPTLSGNGLTWSQLTTYVNDATGTQVRCTVFVAKTGASPSAGAVTADFGGVTQAGCNVIVDECDNADVSGTALQAIVQSKTGTVNGSGTSESITLDSAITSGNASYGMLTHQADETSTNGSGYTTLGNGSHAGPSSALITEYKAAGAQVVDASWTTSAGKGGIALEIKIASGATEYNLVVSDAMHPHAADAIALTANSQLAVTDGAHVHVSDAIALSVSSFIAIDDANHVHAADGVNLTVQSDLAVTDATHAHASDAVTLTANNYLAVDDATHVHVADEVTVTTGSGITLVVQDAAHEHTADPIAILSTSYLVISDATHEHVVDGIALATDSFLLVTDATHTHVADVVTLTFPSDVELIALHLYARDVNLSLNARDLDLSLHTHTTVLTLESL